MSKVTSSQSVVCLFILLKVYFTKQNIFLLIQTFRTINFLLSTSLSAFEFWYVVSSLSIISRYFLISILISSLIYCFGELIVYFVNFPSDFLFLLLCACSQCFHFWKLQIPCCFWSSINANCSITGWLWSIHLWILSCGSGSIPGPRTSTCHRYSKKKKKKKKGKWLKKVPRLVETYPEQIYFIPSMQKCTLRLEISINICKDLYIYMYMCVIYMHNLI